MGVCRGELRATRERRRARRADTARRVLTVVTGTGPLPDDPPTAGPNGDSSRWRSRRTGAEWPSHCSRSCRWTRWNDVRGGGARPGRGGEPADALCARAGSRDARRDERRRRGARGGVLLRAAGETRSCHPVGTAARPRYWSRCGSGCSCSPARVCSRRHLGGIPRRPDRLTHEPWHRVVTVPAGELRSFRRLPCDGVPVGSDCHLG